LIRDPEERHNHDVNDTSDTENSEDNESEGTELEGIGSENPEVELKRGPGRPRKILTGQRGVH